MANIAKLILQSRHDYPKINQGNYTIRGKLIKFIIITFNII